MSSIPRQDLHRALYERCFALMVPMHAAQHHSGRFLNGSTITSGNRKHDYKILNQNTRVFVPIVQASPHLPSMLRFFEAGVIFSFENNDIYQLKQAFDTIDNYLEAGINYLRENYDNIIEERVDAYERLGTLADDLAVRLSDAGYKVKENSVMNILNILSNKGNNLVNVRETRYATLIKSLSRKSTFNRGG